MKTMTHRFPFLLSCLLAVFVFSVSCKKDKPDPEDEVPFEEEYAGLKVHFIGAVLKDKDPVGARPAYWYNGKLSYLAGAEKGGVASDIMMQGQDVYIGGFEGAVGEMDTYRKPVLWTNGKQSYVGNQDDAVVSQLYVTSGKDVYAYGTRYYNKTTGIWKNGQDYPLELKPGRFASISQLTGHNNDFYVVGNLANSTIWKNGKILMERDYGRFFVNVYPVQQDLYTFEASHTNRDPKLPYIWVYKNNKIHQSIIQDKIPWWKVRNVRTFMEGTTTYVAVCFNGEENGPASILVWKDGKLIQEFQDKLLDLQAIFAKNGKLFVIADYRDDQVQYSKCWVDGKELPFQQDGAERFYITQLWVE